LEKKHSGILAVALAEFRHTGCRHGRIQAYWL